MLKKRLNLSGMPVNLSSMPSYASMPSQFQIPYQLLTVIALPDTSEDFKKFHNKANQGIREIFGIWRDEIWENDCQQDYDGISEAFKNDAIDFSYVPKK